MPPLVASRAAVADAVAMPAAPGAGLKRFERLSFVAGAILLALLLRRIGIVTLGRTIAEAGWKLLWVLLLHGVVVFWNTLSWRCVLPEGRRVSLPRLAGMLVAGDGVNTVSPVGVVGGELVRASLLGQFVPPADAAAAVGLAALTQFVGQILFVFSGLPFVLSLVASPSLRQGITFVAGALLICAGIFAFGWTSGATESIQRQVGRWLPIDGLRASLPASWREISRRILDDLRGRPAAFARSTAAAFLGWQSGVIETFVILLLLGVRVGWQQAYAIEVLSVVIEGVLFFVPAKMGTQEGGKVVIFLAMGLEAAKGLALGFLRRLRDLAWAAAGFVVLAAYQRR